jgi:hypothetical protein
VSLTAKSYAVAGVFHQQPEYRNYFDSFDVELLFDNRFIVVRLVKTPTSAFDVITL